MTIFLTILLLGIPIAILALYFVVWGGLKITGIKDIPKKKILGYVFFSLILSLIAEIFVVQTLEIGGNSEVILIHVARSIFSLFITYVLLRYYLRVPQERFWYFFLYLILAGIVLSGLISLPGILSQSVEEKVERGIETYSEVANWQTYTNKVFGFEFKYPLDWRAHVNTFAGEPSMILCPPEFFSEENEVWGTWSGNGEGCASSPRRWFQGDGMVLVEGIGEVTEEDYEKIWKERIADAQPIFVVYLFDSNEKRESSQGDIYLGQSTAGTHFRINANVNDFPEYQTIFNQILSTFRFIEEE